MCKHHVHHEGKIERFGKLKAMGVQFKRKKCVKCGAIYFNNKWSDRIR